VLDEVGDWPKAFQDDDFLFVYLQDASNFFQLPVEITDTSSIDGGTALTLDVYSSDQYKRLVYEGLQGITVDGADLEADLAVDDRLTLLGFFSVNLKIALDAIPATANSPGLAWSVKDCSGVLCRWQSQETGVAEESGVWLAKLDRAGPK
jgi:hypothetical protein